MKYQSVSSLNTDAYRAGNEIGVRLKPLIPEVVLVFLSYNYIEEYSELYQGIKDGLADVSPIVFGCTGDGIYETENVAHHGVCALGMTSEGTVRWQTAMHTGVGQDSFDAARRCAADALSMIGGRASFAMVLADGILSDGSRLVEGFQSVLSIPFIGGLAGDNRKFGQTFVFLNERACDDAVAILLGDGRVPFWMNAASGWIPVGEAGVVERCRGNVIERISGVTAYNFIRAQLGKCPTSADMGNLPLATCQKGAGADKVALRSVMHFNTLTGASTMIGSIEKGSVVRACTATHHDILSGVDQAFQGVDQAPFVPKAMLMVSCAGRKWMLEDPGIEEVTRAFGVLGNRIPMIGFPSFGEIAPFRLADGSYTPSYFHNVTLGLCLLGE